MRENQRVGNGDGIGQTNMGVQLALSYEAPLEGKAITFYLI